MGISFNYISLLLFHFLFLIDARGGDDDVLVICQQGTSSQFRLINRKPDDLISNLPLAFSSVGHVKEETVESESDQR